MLLNIRCVCDTQAAIRRAVIWGSIFYSMLLLFGLLCCMFVGCQSMLYQTKKERIKRAMYEIKLHVCVCVSVSV